MSNLAQAWLRASAALPRPPAAAQASQPLLPRLPPSGEPGSAPRRAALLGVQLPPQAVALRLRRRQLLLQIAGLALGPKHALARRRQLRLGRRRAVLRRPHQLG